MAPRVGSSAAAPTEAVSSLDSQHSERLALNENERHQKPAAASQARWH